VEGQAPATWAAAYTASHGSLRGAVTHVQTMLSAEWREAGRSNQQKRGNCGRRRALRGVEAGGQVWQVQGTDAAGAVQGM
jgi:hypothetical protein